MNDLRRQLVDRIHAAFKDVTLGDGIGLLEARALDDYSGTDIIKEARLKDERQMWTRISLESLKSYSSSLCFLDAKGTRFLLPAFLIANLEGHEGTGDLVFILTHFGHGNMERFSLFNDVQKGIVTDFLKLELKGVLAGFDDPAIENALREFWEA